MSALVMHRLLFTLQARDPVEFGLQAGSQLRGGLYEALRQQSCAAPNGHHDPKQAEFCPVCWLMAREDTEAARGKDVPRAFTIQPPEDLRIAVGDSFQFGMSLFGRAIALFPYLVLALPLMGETGVGYGRGRFTLHRIEAVQPLSGEHEQLYMQSETTVRRQPRLHVSQAAIDDQATQCVGDRVQLNFLTPMRLIQGGQLCKAPVFSVLIARLLERFDLLQYEYGDPDAVSPHEALVAAAVCIERITDQTRWVEIRSGSRRMNNVTPISGFVGKATFRGDLNLLWPWLLWGSCIQVGKDTVKGNGLFRVEETDTL